MELVDGPKPVNSFELFVPSLLVSHPFGHFLVNKSIKIRFEEMFMREIVQIFKLSVSNNLLLKCIIFFFRVDSGHTSCDHCFDVAVVNLF